MITVRDKYDEKALECLKTLVEKHYQEVYKNMIRDVMSEIKMNVEFLGDRIMQENLTSESLIDTYTTWLRLEDRAQQWLNPFSYQAVYIKN